MGAANGMKHPNLDIDERRSMEKLTMCFDAIDITRKSKILKKELTNC